MSTFVAGRRGKWHIARYKPSGYGVAALCGKSWREGDFSATNLRPLSAICRVCERHVSNTESESRDA